MKTDKAQGAHGMTFNNEGRLARRIAMILQHPDVPKTVLEFDANSLGRFIAVQLGRSGPECD